MQLTPEEKQEIERLMEQERSDANKELDEGRTRRCGTCRNLFPLTSANFHKDSKGDLGFKNICKKCRTTAAKAADDRQLIANAKELEKEAEDIVGAANSFLKVTSSAAAKNSVPHLAELYEQMMYVFGGSEGMASRYKETFEAAPEGGSVRRGILDTVLKTGERVSEMGVAQVPTELISDDDLTNEIQNRLKLILGKDAHLVDYLMGNKDKSIIESPPSPELDDQEYDED